MAGPLSHSDSDKPHQGAKKPARRRAPTPGVTARPRTHGPLATRPLNTFPSCRPQFAEAHDERPATGYVEGAHERNTMDTISDVPFKGLCF